MLKMTELAAVGVGASLFGAGQLLYLLWDEIFAPMRSVPADNKRATSIPEAFKNLEFRVDWYTTGQKCTGNLVNHLNAIGVQQCLQMHNIHSTDFENGSLMNSQRYDLVISSGTASCLETTCLLFHTTSDTKIVLSTFKNTTQQAQNMINSVKAWSRRMGVVDICESVISSDRFSCQPFNAQGDSKLLFVHYVLRVLLPLIGSLLPEYRDMNRQIRLAWVVPPSVVQRVVGISIDAPLMWREPAKYRGVYCTAYEEPHRHKYLGKTSVGESCVFRTTFDMHQIGRLVNNVVTRVNLRIYRLYQFEAVLWDHQNNEKYTSKAGHHMYLHDNTGALRRASYAGPGTDLFQNLGRKLMPVNAVDLISMEHDIRYTLANSVEDVKNADRTMLKKLEQVKRTGEVHWADVAMAYNVINAKIKAEQYLLLKPRYFTNFERDNVGIRQDVRQALMEVLLQISRLETGEEIVQALNKNPVVQIPDTLIKLASCIVPSTYFFNTGENADQNTCKDTSPKAIKSKQ